MFEYKYQVLKTIPETTYGSICIKNVFFEPNEIEKSLPEIVFQDDNLMHMFAESFLNIEKRKNIYRRFSPKSKITTSVEDFVAASMKKNKSFYSFLAEGILGLVFRDIYDYRLARGVVDIGDTLFDSHTGVDACMYNLQSNVIVLGEAKFYESLSQGLNKIIDDFIKKDIKNKLESLQTKIECCSDACQIVIKNLSLEDYDELTIEEFMKQKIIFAGFVLHSEIDVSEYANKTFYDSYSISTRELEKNICDSLNQKGIKGDYEIILVHLPIKDKKSLIVKIIETSKDKLKACRGNI